MQAQGPYQDWQLIAPIGSYTATNFGLEVSATEYDDSLMYSKTNSGYEKRRLFYIRYIISNTGSKPVAIRAWSFYVQCPRDRITKAPTRQTWSAYYGSFGNAAGQVKEKTAVIDHNSGLVLEPGDSHILFASGNDFKWCLDDASILVEEPVNFVANLFCAVIPPTIHTATHTPTEETHISTGGEFGLYPWPPPGMGPPPGGPALIAPPKPQPIARHFYTPGGQFRVWELRAPVGSFTTTPFGLRVSAQEYSVAIRYRKINTLDSFRYEKRRVFFTRYIIRNDGRLPILVEDWNFYMQCPRDIILKRYFQTTFDVCTVPFGSPGNSVKELTAVLDRNTRWIFYPGDSQTLFACDNDFFWCLDDEPEVLMKKPLTFIAKITCAVMDTSKAPKQKTRYNDIQFTRGCRNGLMDWPPPDYTPPSSGTPSSQPAVTVALPPTYYINGIGSPSSRQLDPAVLDLLSRYREACEQRDSAKLKDLKLEITDLAEQIYPDRLGEIKKMLADSCIPGKITLPRVASVDSSKNKKQGAVPCLTQKSDYPVAGTYNYSDKTYGEVKTWKLNPDGTGSYYTKWYNTEHTYTFVWGLECEKKEKGERGEKYMFWYKFDAHTLDHTSRGWLNDPNWQVTYLIVIYADRRMAIYDSEKNY